MARPVGNRAKNYTLYVLILVIVIAIFAHSIDTPKEENVDLSTFYQRFDKGDVYWIQISDRRLSYKVKNKRNIIFHTNYIKDEEDLKRFRMKKISVPDPDDPKGKPLTHVQLKVKPPTDIPWWLTLMGSALPFVILIFIFFYFIQKMHSGGAKALSFGKSRARFLDSTMKKTTFADVAGCDEAKADLEEIIDFLKAPRKFQAIGARIPRGVLIMGPPGTGKTLLARAVAGEANVPFLHISGSDFVEMFVGVGASRVRDLFEQGKKHAPCIVFIDEIDAVGRQRGSGLGGGHDEREQTLNQLLVEMDGFDTNEGVIVMAATNRPDVLDPALMRPGRFDRQVIVDLPDVRGREGIFKVHVKSIPMADDVDLPKLAKATPGFSGADVANMVNEAALLAARRDRKRVGQLQFEEARDKILMGPERRSRVLSEKTLEKVAYHEAGHALVQKLTPGLDQIHKVSIIPRGRALGVTASLPEEEKLYLREKGYILSTCCSLLGGRVAEELRYGEITSGAANDIDRVTKMVHQMVCEFGMSEKLGPVCYGESKGMIFLGRDLTRDRTYSEETAREIDLEIKRVIEQQYQVTRELLESHRDDLTAVAEALIEHEVLDNEQIDRLLAGEKLEPPLPEEPEEEELIVEDEVEDEDEEEAEDPILTEMPTPATAGGGDSAAG